MKGWIGLNEQIENKIIDWAYQCYKRRKGNYQRVYAKKRHRLLSCPNETMKIQEGGLRSLACTPSFMTPKLSQIHKMGGLWALCAHRLSWRPNCLKFKIRGPEEPRVRSICHDPKLSWIFKMGAFGALRAHHLSWRPWKLTSQLPS